MENKSWKRYFFVSLAFNMVVIFSFIFFSFILDHKKPETPEYQHPLTKAQETLIESKRDIFKSKADSIWAKVGDERFQLWQELLNSPPDTSIIDSTVNQIINDEINVRQSTYQYFLTQMFILTPKQRQERLSRLMNNYQKRHK